MLSLERAALALAALSLATLLLLAGRPSFTNASRPPRGISDPGIALQMARDVNEVDAIIGDVPSPDREVMRMKQYVNFGFVACYTGLFLVLSVALARRSAKTFWGRPLAIALALAALAAAIFDVRDDQAILRLIDIDLSHTSQAAIDALRKLSSVKWGLASAGMGLVSVFFLAARKWGLRIVGLVNLAAAIAGLAGLFQNSLLVWTIALMAVGLLLDAIMLRFLNYESAS